jgi:hypothetical protein
MIYRKGENHIDVDREDETHNAHDPRMKKDVVGPGS